MIAYDIGVLPLIRELLESHPEVSQLWYADNVGNGRISPHIISHLYDIMVRGPHRGYSPELTKSILLVSEPNLAKAESLFRGEGITIVMGSRYFGGYIGDAGPQAQWLGDKVRDWKVGICMMTGLAHKHP